jgi:hypothetical protein
VLKQALNDAKAAGPAAPAKNDRSEVKAAEQNEVKAAPPPAENDPQAAAAAAAAAPAPAPAMELLRVPNDEDLPDQSLPPRLERQEVQAAARC